MSLLFDCSMLLVKFGGRDGEPKAADERRALVSELEKLGRMSLSCTAGEELLLETSVSLAFEEAAESCLKDIANASESSLRCLGEPARRYEVGSSGVSGGVRFPV